MLLAPAPPPEAPCGGVACVYSEQGRVRMLSHGLVPFGVPLQLATRLLLRHREIALPAGFVSVAVVSHPPQQRYRAHSYHN